MDFHQRPSTATNVLSGPELCLIRYHCHNYNFDFQPSPSKMKEAMKSGIASMAAEAAAKANSVHNTPTMTRHDAPLADTEIREVEVEVAIDPPCSNGHISQL